MENHVEEKYYIPLVKLSMAKERELPYEGKEINSAEKTAKLAEQILEGADREHLLVISINCACRPVAVEIVAIGALNSVVIQPREIFKHAILSNAAGIVVVHNHPSGKCTPSREDEAITRKMIRAGDLLGIWLEDHIIIGEGYYSFREEGLISEWRTEIAESSKEDGS